MVTLWIGTVTQVAERRRIKKLAYTDTITQFGASSAGPNLKPTANTPEPVVINAESD
jgi:hypothetical protein